MSLRIKPGQTITTIKVVQDSQNKSLFNLDLEDLGTTQIEYHLPIVDAHFEEIENYDIFLFKNRFGNFERDIFQICIKGDSIGWMLPLSIYDSQFDFGSEILSSSNHKTYRFFLKMVAYPAFHKLLLAENTPSKIPTIQDTSNLNLNLLDFYDKDTNVLIISKKRLHDLSIDFDLDLYLPSFYKYGYVKLDAPEDFEDIDFNPSNRNAYLKDLKTFDKINISPISKDLVTEKYVIELFKNVLKRKLHPLVRFHFLYQVIELLINKIGVENYKKKLQDGDKVDANFIVSYLRNFNNLMSGNFQSVNDIKEASLAIGKTYDYLNSVPNEEDRIKILFDNSSIIDINYKELLGYSKAITNMNEDILHKNIYKVRNALVHSYHDLYKKDTEIDVRIQNVNMRFEDIIVDILVQFISK